MTTKQFDIDDVISDRDWVDTADVAKLVRRQLKIHFPETKFSVRISRYSGGSSIDVRWTDGPTEDAVDPHVKQFSGARFDGMIDLAYRAEHWLLPDGTATVRREYGHSYRDAEVHNEDQPVPEGARIVHFGASYIFTQRELSDERKAAIIGALESYYGITYEPNRYYDGFQCYGQDLLHRFQRERGL